MVDCGAGASCVDIPAAVSAAESFESTAWATNGVVSPDSSSQQWTRGSGHTPSGDTGPSAAGADTFYIFTEASSYNNQYFILDLPPVEAYAEYTLTFLYHMYGSAMGTLSVQVLATGTSTWSDEWSRSGQQHTGHDSAWAVASVTVSSGVASGMRIVGYTGNGFQSDIAIDEVSISRWSADHAAGNYTCVCNAGTFGSTTTDTAADCV